MPDSVRDLFDYPNVPHRRRHAPRGYLDYKSYKPWLRDEFVFRCVYCLVRERWFPFGSDAFSIDHVTPQTSAPFLITDYGNLVYACLRCNAVRQDHSVLDPCAVAFADHLRVADDGAIEGLTAEGKTHLGFLRLDDPRLTEFRGRMIRNAREWTRRADEDALNELSRWLQFPDDLPNLPALRPPGGNTQPDATRDCWYERRKQGTLPPLY